MVDNSGWRYVITWLLYMYMMKLWAMSRQVAVSTTRSIIIPVALGQVEA